MQWASEKYSTLVSWNRRIAKNGYLYKNEIRVVRFICKQISTYVSKLSESE